MTRLVVLWQMPDARFEFTSGDHVLSYLPVEREREVASAAVRLVSARTLAREMRPLAREVLAAVCAKLGTTADERGNTLRAALTSPGECSDWWFHPLSARHGQAGSMTVLEQLVCVLTIDRCAETSCAGLIVTFGADDAIVDTLRSRYRVCCPRQRRRWWRHGWLTATLSSRIAFARETIRLKRLSRISRRVATETSSKPLIALTTSWHSWLKWDADRDTLVDIHFKGLPSELQSRGARVRYYVWLSMMLPHQVLQCDLPPFRDGRVTSLQGWLNTWDVLREALSFRTAVRYLVWRRRAPMDALRWGALDLYPLLRFPLLYYCLGPVIPWCRLLALATRRACAADPPSVTLSHFELFPGSLAHYEGVRRARCNTTTATMQHSANVFSVSSLDPVVEFKGTPDGCAVPHAAHVFTMGKLGYQRFLRCGYAPDQLSSTGSTRFDYLAALAANGARRPKAAHEPLRLVLALGTSPDDDCDLIEAACLAADGLPRIQLRVRRRPDDRLLTFPRFTALLPRIRLSDRSLAAEIAAADLVLFTSASFAAEAYVCGVPVWQWISPCGADASLPEIADIPALKCVEDLRTRLGVFAQDPSRFAVGNRAARNALEEIFGKSDGAECRRIATQLLSLAA